MTSQVVVGDLLMLNMGDLLPADGVFVAGTELKLDESAMTGACGVCVRVCMCACACACARARVHVRVRVRVCVNVTSTSSTCALACVRLLMEVFCVLRLL